MVNKRGNYLLILGILALIASISLVSALCDPSQTILKLSSSTNAHAQTWEQSSYPVEICYSDIFGAIYQGANPHSCSGTNGVINLSSSTNAHASSSYPVAACYGDIRCGLVNAASCPSSEKMVLSLSSPTNAHLANDSSYDYKLCCSSHCGDGLINSGEQCDGANVTSNGLCASYNSSYFSGTLSCTSQCTLNTSQCVLKESTTANCSSDGNKLLIFQNGFNIENRSTIDSSACAGPDGMTGGNYSNDDCCPQNLICSTSGSSKGCKTVQQSSSCSQITTESTCNNAPSQIYSQDTVFDRCGDSYQNENDSCTYNIDCIKCKWNSSASTCDLVTRNSRAGCTNDGFVPTTCSHYLSFLGECSNGATSRIVRDVATKLDGPVSGSCVSKDYEVGCGTSALEAPFFSMLNMVISIISIMIIYMFYVLFRKREK